MFIESYVPNAQDEFRFSCFTVFQLSGTLQEGNGGLKINLGLHVVLHNSTKRSTKIYHRIFSEKITTRSALIGKSWVKVRVLL